MILNEPLSMSWRVYTCEIHNDEIIEVKGAPVRDYNPFKHYENNEKDVLYRKFISINESNNDEILEFIRLFGFLGLNSMERINHSKVSEAANDYYATKKNEYIIRFFAEKISYLLKSPKTPEEEEEIALWEAIAIKPEIFLKLLRSLASSENKDSLDIPSVALNNFISNNNKPIKENLSDIKNEIRRMRLILQLWDSLSFKDIELIDKNTLTLWTFGEDDKKKQVLTEEFRHSESYEVALYFAKSIIGAEINKQIVHVRPYLLHDDTNKFLENPNKIFKGDWHCPDLLSAMYIMIYMDFIQGKMIRKCRNETCPYWFEIYGNDVRKIYCDSKCANTQAKRASRRMKKERGQ